MKVVVLHKYSKLYPLGQKVVLEINPREVSSDISLTKKALSHWKSTKNNSGFAKFNTLSKRDILSVISATKRKEGIMEGDRFGGMAFYNLNVKRWL